MGLRFAAWCGLALLLCLASSFAQQTSTPAEKKLASSPAKHKLGPLDITVNWRARAEGWDWFKGPVGHGNYTFGDSLFRIGVGQQSEHFDWFVEGAQVAIVGLPTGAVAPAPQGQLGLGANYYVANDKSVNNVGGFLKQGYVQFKDLGHKANLKLGRFEYFDGAEVKPKDPTLATLEQTRISQRLLANFGFSAVQRSFDGVQLSSNIGNDNLTFFAARPTEGVFQVQGMGELDVDTYYGSFTVPVGGRSSAGEFRVFGVGYIDHRVWIEKTDNRANAAKLADTSTIEIGTYGADYLHVFNTPTAGKFDFLVWGVVQNGSWGVLSQDSGAFVGEAGWQAPVRSVKPWFSVGYSYGSGDGNPNDTRHGTFFQLLTTPRQYARFPFYNMMNNEDFYGTLNLKPTSKLGFRSEAHALRLASAKDFWYSGGGAFQSSTFGFTGRPAPGNGNRGLANVWDLSTDYQFTPMFGATLYYGQAWGKSTIAKIYPKDPDGHLLFLETNLRF